MPECLEVLPSKAMVMIKLQQSEDSWQRINNFMQKSERFRPRKTRQVKRYKKVGTAKKTGKTQSI